MKNGEYHGHVQSIAISISGDRPAIFTRLSGTLEGETTKVLTTHVIRLNKPDSLRIGFDELRSAFPALLAQLNDEQLLTFLIEKTSELEGKPIRYGIEPQMKNNVQAKDPKTGTPYFNVRLRSDVRNMQGSAATDLAKRLLAGVTTKKAVNDAFAELNEKPKARAA